MKTQDSFAHYLVGIGVSTSQAKAAATQILNKIEKRQGLNGAEATVFSAYANDSKAPAVPQSTLMALTAAKAQSGSDKVAIKWTYRPSSNGIASVEWTYSGNGYTASDDLFKSKGYTASDDLFKSKGYTASDDLFKVVGYTATDDLWTFTATPTPGHIRKAVHSVVIGSQPSGI